MRWVVGDVQGCAIELDRLIEFVRFDPERDELWSVGDLVERGPDSAAAVRLWRDVGGRGVLGNHEIATLRAAAGDRVSGGRALLDAPDADRLLDLLRALPLLVRLDSPGGGAGCWVVHAGVRPGWDDLEAASLRLREVREREGWERHDDVSFVTRVRCCTPEGELCRHSGRPENCPPGSRPWDALYSGRDLVVHGHWAARGHYRGAHTLGLDSGCVYGGWLTGWCQEEDRIVQIPARASGLTRPRS